MQQPSALQQKTAADDDEQTTADAAADARAAAGCERCEGAANSLAEQPMQAARSRLHALD